MPVPPLRRSRTGLSIRRKAMQLGPATSKLCPALAATSYGFSTNLDYARAEPERLLV